MRQSQKIQWAACVCLLCLLTAFLSAAHDRGQTAVHAGEPHTAPHRVSLGFLSNRVLLDNSSAGADATLPREAAAIAPAIASKPTILQAADVTFRLVGSDAQPFNNATAQAFQKALHSVFSNFSSAAFVYQSAVVRISPLPCDTTINNDSISTHVQRQQYCLSRTCGNTNLFAIQYCNRRH